MIFPQISSAKHTINVPGRCVSFGANVPYRTKLWFDGALGDPVRVEPYDIFTRPFRSLQLQFPSSINDGENLELVIHETEYALQKHRVAVAHQELQSSQVIGSGATFDLALSTLGYKNGAATRGTVLTGFVEAAGTGNLPTAWLMWNDRFGTPRHARTGRFANGVGGCYLNLNGWDYPQPGGVLRILNGAANREFAYALWAVSP
jgi:hypothetical protein